MKILAVCKDPSGTAGLLPVVEELKKRNHEVTLAANGKAVEVLTKCSQKFLNCEGISTEAWVTDMEEKGRMPDVFISTMCTKGGVGRDLVPFMRARGVPVIALQDFWVGAAGQADAWLEAKYRPDYITTNDEVGKDLLTKVWPTFDPTRIVITGFPAFDKYAGMDFDAKRSEAREKLGLSPESGPVISFAGGGPLTHLAHEMLGRALQKLAPRQFFAYLPRPHPRTMNDFSEEADPWQKTVAAVGRFAPVLYDFFGRCEMGDVVAASNVVCSISSTTLLDAG